MGPNPDGPDRRGPRSVDVRFRHLRNRELRPPRGRAGRLPLPDVLVLRRGRRRRLEDEGTLLWRDCPVLTTAGRKTRRDIDAFRQTRPASAPPPAANFQPASRQAGRPSPPP